MKRIAFFALAAILMLTSLSFAVKAKAVSVSASAAVLYDPTADKE